MGDQSPTGSKLSPVLIKIKPYLAMVSLQFGYAGMYIISMVSFKHGMSNFVLSVYRHVVAFCVIAPFAFVLERFSLSLSIIYLFSIPLQTTMHACISTMSPKLYFKRLELS